MLPFSSLNLRVSACRLKTRCRYNGIFYQTLNCSLDAGQVSKPAQGTLSIRLSGPLSYGTCRLAVMLARKAD